MTSERRLDRKLAHILAGEYVPEDFILADAKDADMAWGIAAPGVRAGCSAAHGAGGFRSRADYLDDMRVLVERDAVDIMLTSASNGERLSAGTDLGDVTLAVRANDSTDVWNTRHGAYTGQPSRPFRSANLAAVKPFCDLVLYSVTFNNDLMLDTATLSAYREFRGQAMDLDLRHFLEVFNPNAPVGLDASQVGAFVNDSIIRGLAGVTSSERPLFLKIAYNGHDALKELVEHDDSIVVGVLGGSAGTTRDTFELLQRVQHAGGRVALFGRKIQQAESQLDLVRLMRQVLRGDLPPSDAVRAYHDSLRSAGIAPIRPVEQDVDVTDPVLRGE